MARVAVGLTIVFFCAALSACGGTSGALSRSSAVSAPVSPTVLGAPPTPAATDWKGLFDSDSQPYDVAPRPESVLDVRRREPPCSRALTVASGAFTAQGRDENAYLLACGTHQRVVIANEQTTLVSLDVPEDVLLNAGDVDLDGDSELLLIGHTGPRITVRVLEIDGAKLEPVYAFDMTHEPCTHTIIYYRLVKPRLEFREEKQPKACDSSH